MDVGRVLRRHGWHFVSLGYDGLAWVLGWTGGFVLVSILIGPYLRKFGAYTVPDFMAFRFGGNLARGIAVVVLVCCSFTYVTAQIYGTGLIASRFLGMQFEIAVFAGLVGILLCAMLGGMRAVTWTQIAQYIVLIVAYLTPIVILSTKHYGIPIPELTYGTAIAEITAREQQMLATGLATAATLKPHIQPFIKLQPAELLRDHLLHDGRYGVVAAHSHALFHHPVGARSASIGGLVAILHFLAVLLGAGLCGVFEARSLHQHNRQGSHRGPALDVHLGELGLIQICGKNAASIDAIVAACKTIAGHPGVVRLQDFVINTGRDRALYPGGCGPSLRDLGSGCCRRSRSGALDR